MRPTPFARRSGGRVTLVVSREGATKALGRSGGGVARTEAEL